MVIEYIIIGAVTAIVLYVLIAASLTVWYGAPPTETTWTMGGTYTEVCSDGKPFTYTRHVGEHIIAIAVLVGGMTILGGGTLSALYVIGVVVSSLF